MERKYKIYPFSKPPHFNLAPAIEAWLRGTSFDNMLRFTDTDEGEVVRYFRMAMQILREISDAKSGSALLKERIKETRRVINRGVVDAEKQLREN
jgi:superfamily II RNA helicase